MRGKAFLKLASIDLSFKLSITYGRNVNYYKSVHHPIATLPVGTGTPLQFSKQISKLSFQLSFQIYSLLAQTKMEKKPFLEGCKNGDQIVRLSSRSLGCHKM